MEKKVRKFLTKYKIYFEIVSTILLAGMAVIVSIHANQISKKSHDLQMITHLPIVNATFKFIENNKGVRKEELLIVNDGDSLYELTYKAIAQISITEYIQFYPNKKIDDSLVEYSAILPLVSYYPYVESRLESNKGTIVKLTINDANLMNDEFVFFREQYSDGKKSAQITIERFLFVSFLDKFGNNHEKYYKFGLHGDSIPLNINDGMERFAVFDQVKKNFGTIEYGNSTHKEINSLWEKVKKPKAR